MEAKQKQSIESYLRVQVFLNTFPAPAPASYAEPKKVLDDVVAQLTDHASGQELGQRQSQAELLRQESLKTKLRERHLRPIWAIARASLKEAPGIDAALRIPPVNYGALRTVAAAKAVRGAVVQYEPEFVKNGRPADFIARLSAAIEELESSMVGRAANGGVSVGARAGIGQQIQRGRRAVQMLDAIVRAAYEGNDVVLAQWRIAMRVKNPPGGGPRAAEVVAQQPPPAPKPAAA